MSVYQVRIRDGAKVMSPILHREDYLKARDSLDQRQKLAAVRQGNDDMKSLLVQMNYSCLPNDDGTLKGSKRISKSVGMDIDFKPPKELSDEEQKTWLAQQMAGVPELVIGKKQELGLQMLERSAKKGYHLVFKRRPELSQEENLKWASELLGVKFDDNAKDITRVFFTTTADELLFLDDEIFDNGEAEQGDTLRTGTLVTSEISQTFQSPSVTYDPEAGYNGMLFKDIIAKYWELFNGGKEPSDGDRNAHTFELALTLRSICGYSHEKLQTVIPNYWMTPDGKCSEKDLAEYHQTLDNALKEVRKMDEVYSALDALGQNIEDISNALAEIAGENTLEEENR